MTNYDRKSDIIKAFKFIESSYYDILIDYNYDQWYLRCLIKCLNLLLDEAVIL